MLPRGARTRIRQASLSHTTLYFWRRDCLAWKGNALFIAMLKSDYEIDKRENVDNGHGDSWQWNQRQLNTRGRVTNAMDSWRTAYTWKRECRRRHMIERQRNYSSSSGNQRAPSKDVFRSHTEAGDQYDHRHVVYREENRKNRDEKSAVCLKKWAYGRYHCKFWKRGRWIACRRCQDAACLHSETEFGIVSFGQSRNGYLKTWSTSASTINWSWDVFGRGRNREEWQKLVKGCEWYSEKIEAPKSL